MRFKKLYAVVASATLALMGSASFAGAAFADNPVESNPALIDAGKKATLHITKYLGYPISGKANNGTQQKDITSPTLTGVNFDVYQVFVVGDNPATKNVTETEYPVDLTTNAGWELASKLKGATVTDETVNFTSNGQDFKLTKKSTVTTANGGVADYSNADLGVYYVKENLASSTSITASDGTAVTKSSLSGSAPFFVTLPMTNPNKTTEWMYDVYVYPKNQNSGIEKDVLDAVKGKENQDGYKVGQNVTFVIKTDISVADANNDGTVDGKDIKYYAIWDTLQKELTFVTDPAPVLKIVKADSSEVSLVADTDYKQAYDSTTGKVSWSFTDDGLAKLAQADKGKVVTEFVSQVNAMPKTGVISNTANFYPNGDSLSTPAKPGDTPPDGSGVPSNETKLYYGNIQIEKYDPQNSNADMQGVEFALYRDANDDGACSADEVQPSKSIMTATVGEGNKATFSGLHVSTYWNNKDKDGNETAGIDVAPSKYCVVETKAKDGYNLDATPRPVAIDHTTRTAEAAPFVTLKVANEETNLGNKLPLTGGQGIALVSMLGAAFIGCGAVLYTRSSRRKAEAAN